VIGLDLKGLPMPYGRPFYLISSGLASVKISTF